MLSPHKSISFHITKTITIFKGNVYITAMYSECQFEYLCTISACFNKKTPYLANIQNSSEIAMQNGNNIEELLLLLKHMTQVC